MAKVLSSISGNLISAASAGYAPTNSADVSAIASGYQVVSSTATQLYAGTAYLTSINGAPVSASRAGQAANASLANSAYYDGTGRLISALPDSAAVSSIASSYAESAVSGVVDTVSSNSATWGAGVSLPISGSAGDDSGIYDANYVEFTRYDTAGEPDIRTARLTPDYFSIDYTLDGNDHTSMMLNESMLDFGDSDGDHIVDAYSIDSWNSAVDTVANNSASWGGGATGDYVEKSATALAIGSAVTANGNSFAQGTTCSADTNALAQGSQAYAYYGSIAAGAKDTAYFVSVALGYNNNASWSAVAIGSENSATNGMAVGRYNSAYTTSVAIGAWNSASGDSVAIGGSNKAKNWSVAFGIQNSAINSATVIGQFNLHGDGDTATGNSAAFVIGDGTSTAARHDLMLVTKDGEITMYSSTADTVGTGIMSSIRAISAAATGGGVDSATVSAIASSYAESAASSKQDLSAMSAYALSSDVSGVIDTVSANSAAWGQGGVDSATVSSIASSYAESAVSSKLDSSASSSFYTTANESGYVGSAYVDSAVSGKMDTSAMTSYALSSDVSGTVDLVSTQSANWGGSALALSAGPGVSLTMVGNTLVAGLDGLDETVLWEGTLNTLNSDIACSENLSNFRTIKIFYRLVADSIVQSVGVHEFEPSEMSSNHNVSFGGFYLISNNFYGWWLGRLVVTDGYKVKITNTKNSWGTGSSPTDGTTNQSTVGYIYKIVGIGRTAGV